MPENLALQSDKFKEKVKVWLRSHIGEPVGPDGKHLPIPNLVDSPRSACAECPEDAVKHLRGWFANGDRVEIPLCGSHSAMAREFLQRRRQELKERDAARKLRRDQAGHKGVE